ncbi:hypothetical protein EVAR_46190_1 [Eumeta japonica]|uniref:Uncharacterized protein n=1 Tax=Eumeta variegata TaxID=151549 RepID=A0A4C1WF95_EUMVA|nr:hypothetical protein EVAR_46190_1 [Eumeta japonica]
MTAADVTGRPSRTGDVSSRVARTTRVPRRRWVLRSRPESHLGYEGANLVREASDCDGCTRCGVGGPRLRIHRCNSQVTALVRFEVLTSPAVELASYGAPLASAVPGIRLESYPVLAVRGPDAARGSVVVHVCSTPSASEGLRSAGSEISSLPWNENVIYLLRPWLLESNCTAPFKNNDLSHTSMRSDRRAVAEIRAEHTGQPQKYKANSMLPIRP